MHLFEITTADGSTIPVFAAAFDEAATLFTGWHVSMQGTQVPDFEVRQRNPRWPGLNNQHLAEALARNQSGVGSYDPAIGWTIASASSGSR
ncbi:hypothetical protein NYR55_04265 [Sphingomonas sp. BGYR3]|uniref:hypothetical protein n=1 Tax=Sphingomonas sp. BGYR3 TaxID=2975483 RepID=UPI0021A9389A|nr:hypothetical protein [Sphingomonas sp. BGYR3]MDG5487833.1 hypothetical protein [Sphingomonas sp. BGYR3]